jgi:hypothetical protein
MKKLTLQKETLRRLQSRDAQAIVGGTVDTNPTVAGQSICSGGTDGGGHWTDILTGGGGSANYCTANCPSAVCGGGGGSRECLAM